MPPPLLLSSCCLLLAAVMHGPDVWAATGITDTHGRQFLTLNVSKTLEPSQDLTNHSAVFSTTVLSSALDFDELIVSWNANLPTNAFLEVDVRAIYSDRATRYYNLGAWSSGGTAHPRRSLNGQIDEDGEVATDTLRLRRRARAFQLRLSSDNEIAPVKWLKFLGVSLADSSFGSKPLGPHRKAWGRSVPVPERTQMIYPNGKTLCSPTTVSMILGYWAQTLHEPELDRPVPEIAEDVYDSTWKGTGNWSFNVAYAGSLPGMRAYVARLSDVSELEAWIARELPVGLSLDYDRLRGKGPGPNGHLVVLVGFTAQGDPIVNDPGTSEHVRKTFPRANLIDAWACSRNTVYFIYPENAKLPRDLFGHWDSELTRR